MLRISIIGFILSAVFLYGCSSPNSLTKKGDKLQTAGMHQEAANLYYNALRKNRNHVNAKIGMRTSGQMVLNDKLQTFTKHRSFGLKKDAVYAFLDAEAYYNKINAVGVVLTFPEFHRADYEGVKVDYLTELYDKGTQLMEQEQFNEAKTLFAEITKLDPAFRDTGSLKQVATIEPFYRKGVTAFEAKRFREAHSNLLEVQKRDANYKDTNQLISQSLQRGQYGVAVMSFDNASGVQEAGARMSAYAMTALTKVNDPFLKVIDRENFDKIINEQKLGLSGVIDEKTAAEVGNLLGARALLTGTVLSQKTTEQKITFQTKNGYEAYQVKKVNPETNQPYFETQYKSVTYREYYGKNSVVLTVQYRLTSLETGEVILSKVVERNTSDEVAFATFDGNRNNLYPAGSNNTVLSGKADYQRLQNLLDARKTLNDLPIMVNQSYDQAAGIVANELGVALKTLVP
jgi:tetratricopeptide (TPR) repeat protein